MIPDHEGDGTMRRQRKRGSIVTAWGIWLAMLTLSATVALATSPVIGKIPPPIVGGGETTSPPNTFVYSDALNLNSWVADDGGIENIAWSYEIVGEQIYSINGNAPIVSSSEDPTSPTTVGKDLYTVRNGEDNPDGLGQTITIRNVHLSPFGGPNNDPGEMEGILSSETQAVTLYASDGSTYTQKEFMIYTDNEGEDRLSPGCDSDCGRFEIDFTTGSHGYTSTGWGGTTVTVGSNGICIEVAAANTNIGRWTSPYPMFEMAGNSVYRVRANMNGSQTTPGLVPLWDIVIQNFDSADGVGGANAYFADYLFLDNEGGANAVGPTSGITDIELFFVPLPARSPAWNDTATGAYSVANDDKNDIQLIFRVLDADERGGFGGELDVGQVCIQTITIDRFDLDTGVIEVATVMDLNLDETHFRGEDLLDSTTFDWGAAGQVTIGPTDGNFETEISYLQPGDGDHMGIGGSGAAEDDYPIVWEDNTIYMIEVDVSAPTAGDEEQPVDVIQVGMDPPTWECFMLNTVTRGDSTMHNIGMPKSGTPQTYVTFFNGHQASLSAQSDFVRLRPRVQILNAVPLIFFFEDKNTGDITIHGIRVKKVTM